MSPSTNRPRADEARGRPNERNGRRAGEAAHAVPRKGLVRRFLRWFCLMCAWAALVGLPGLASGPEEPAPAPAAGAGQTFEQRWGIEVLGIRLTAEGYMLDFRYRVLDPEKARPVFNRSVKPYLLHEGTGAKFMVPAPPKVGPLRASSNFEPNRNYFMLFANPGRFVKRGDHVSIIVGEFKAEHLTVE